jgi:hypothetical protein
MAFLADRVYDLGLNVLDTEANRIDFCSAEPTTYTQATSTLSLAGTTSFSIGSPASGSPNGRQVTVAATSGVSVSTSGTITHWAITDTSNSRLLATGSLNTSRAVTAGDQVNSASFTVRIPAAEDA